MDIARVSTGPPRPSTRDRSEIENGPAVLGDIMGYEIGEILEGGATGPSVIIIPYRNKYVS